MKNRKIYGVSSTRNEKHNVGDKLNVVISNRNTGNAGIFDGYSKLKSQKAVTRLKKIKEFMVKKSKFIRAEEFAGKGKIIEVLDVDTEANGKFGESVHIKLREPETKNERIWNTSSIRALSAISPLLERGITLLHVWTTGTGMDTMYYAEDANVVQSTKVQKGNKVRLNGARARRTK